MDSFDVLKYIYKYTIKHGYSPSIREIGAHFELNTITVSGICIGLKQLGYLENTHKKARALIVTPKGLDVIGYSIPEVTIINDKAYVRLTEYQDLQNRLSKRICELQADLGKARETIKVMKTCPMLICPNCQQDCIANTEYNKDWFENWETKR